MLRFSFGYSVILFSAFFVPSFLRKERAQDGGVLMHLTLHKQVFCQFLSRLLTHMRRSCLYHVCEGHMVSDVLLHWAACCIERRMLVFVHIVQLFILPALSIGYYIPRLLHSSEHMVLFVDVRYTHLDANT